MSKKDYTKCFYFERVDSDKGSNHPHCKRYSCECYAFTKGLRCDGPTNNITT